MNDVQLNLARKSRPRTFDQIIGQDLAVKMLKNSLYRTHLFPVYLFCGQRGTGKTSMARVFAAAINCFSLSKFQKDPKNTCVPCLQCPSCKAMLAGKHPDFIEIDAASNTGVDNVRTIIDQATLLPLMGHKKIYLIDEAHMLSKAAFNALLKILEEPPTGTLFMLATTESHKIIDTVKSRCFQVHFKSIDITTLVDHLAAMCKEESIYADKDALILMALESEGSARDAINILERVRFSQGRITREAVLAALGHIDDAALVSIIDLITLHESIQLMHLISELSFDTFDADYIYKRLTELMRALTLARCGLSTMLPAALAQEIARCAQRCSLEYITDLIQLLYDHERLFTKTGAKHPMLEMILLKMSALGKACPTSQITPINYPKQESVKKELPVETASITINDEQRWKSFIEQITLIGDQLLLSIFNNAVYRGYDSTTGKLNIAFARQFIFFQDWISHNEGAWKTLLQKSFGPKVCLEAQFTDEVAPVVNTVSTSFQKMEPQPVQQRAPVEKKTNFNQYKPTASNERLIKKLPAVDVSDQLKWPKASLILTHFQGIIRQA